MDQYLVIVPLLPFLAFVINGLWRNRMSKNTVIALAVGSVGLSFVTSVLLFIRLLGLAPEQRLIQQTLFTWIPVGTLKLDMAFMLDPLSAVMILVVTGVGFLIHVYSIGYMAHDEGIKRFFVYMNLFMFSMLTLVMADNLGLLFVGWEGVGLCSYLLIGFWFHKDSAANAGKKAFIVNRIGDVGFLLGTFLIFWTAGTLRFPDLAARAPEVFALGGGAVTAATLLLFVGATGKSAQIPLYVWLPDAMEGPTPVSALIHAATMVTAGVYLLARLNFLFILAPTTLVVVAIVGCVTALFAATIGLAQNDIKRVLAYSTISQLGYMMMACGVAAFGAGIFHLMTHAFFKALLFLGAGSVIHAMSDEQDMRKMGGLKKQLPTTYNTFLMATLAIVGIPIFSGFFSKDDILWQAFSSGHGNPLFWLIGVLTAGLTAFYMFRLFYLTFHGQPRYDQQTADHLHESPRVMTVPLVILAVLSIVGGWIGWPKVLLGGAWFERFLAPVMSHAGGGAAAETVGHSPSLEYGLMAVTIALVLVSIYAAYSIYNKSIGRATSLRQSLSGVYKVIYNKYWVDEFYGATIVRPLVKGSIFLWKIFDVVIIDGFANGLAYLTGDASTMGRKMQTGHLREYLTAFLIGTVLVIGFLIVR
ncbi:MAG: NADH-quinone oxidoreductase subunit L [candidate division Zixibacteria bacterium]|nr:NADH-quinone oxidoreductase subunit L [candidate division Zixibacteria bacterium]